LGAHDVAEAEVEEGFPALAFGFDFEEAAFDAMEAVVAVIFGGRAGRSFGYEFRSNVSG